MNDDQVTRILEELSKTRESFEETISTFQSATESIKWNRRNTIVQYVLIAMVFVIGAIGLVNYMHDRTADCERNNDLLRSMEENAFEIGAALAVVFDAPQERLDQYLAAYNEFHSKNSGKFKEC